MTVLSSLTQVKGRFARSVRLDTNDRENQLAGYLPTARALEVVRRVVRGMADQDTGARAFSITGPYGSGKSSLGVFLDALMADIRSNAHRDALDLLVEHDPDTALLLRTARDRMGAKAAGWARAVVTAPQREPITATVLRALTTACSGMSTSKSLRGDLATALRRAEDPRLGSPSYGEVKVLFERIAEKRPVLLVIDEFGKNLEAFAESGADGDMYLLQELAEWATNGDLPLVVVTIQHLAFEAYAADANAAKRREWAKVQGRFEDIPFVDSASATRALISVALDHDDHKEYTRARRRAGRKQAEAAEQAHLSEVADAELVAGCYPLHPSTLVVLPELCSRYGQNERTLFSFLASHEPLSVTSFLDDRHLDGPLDWVRLDRVYDYFVESASTFVGVARDASRWIEIETTIRDAHGLTPAQERVLKTIGVLNLVSSSGTLRASKDLLVYACNSGVESTATGEQVTERLAELEHAGLITFRDFASEYRIWRGSDFDLSSAMTVARRQVRDQSLARILDDVLPLPPVVAARHATNRGTLRAFRRVYADSTTRDLTDLLPRAGDVCDGLLVYALEPLENLGSPETPVPVVVVAPQDHHPVVSAAIEVAGLKEVGADPALPRDDQAIAREIAERTAYAEQALDQTVAAAYNHQATWTWLNPTEGADGTLRPGFGTRPLSDVLDLVYPAELSPAVRYEVINRAELTSQGAKARRNVLEALVNPTTVGQPALGFEGDGPEPSIYHAILGAAGVHTPEAGVTSGTADGAWDPVWQALSDEISRSPDPISLPALLDLAMAPPYGLREGTATVLLTALLVAQASALAIYEHGTFTPRLDAPLSERMVRNPVNFAIKSLNADSPKRTRFLETLNSDLDERKLPQGTSITVLSTVRRFVQVFVGTPTYTRRTRRFHGIDLTRTQRREVIAVRDALITATEPDRLLFELLPQAVGYGPVRLRGGTTEGDFAALSDAVCDAVETLVDTFPALLRTVAETIVYHGTTPTVRGARLGLPTGIDQLRGDATLLRDIETLTPAVKRFTNQVGMIADPQDPRDIQDWAARLATGVADGAPPQDWADPDVPGYLKRIGEVAGTFHRTATMARAAASASGSGEEHDPFDAYAVSITAADGSTALSEVVALRASDAAAADAALASALDHLVDVTGSRQDAIRLTLGWLAKNSVDCTAPRHASPTMHDAPDTGMGTSNG